jgi:AraC-like DNA-binding protein
VIAERAGFRSPRRMTAAFVHVYGRPPSALTAAKCKSESRRRTPHARITSGSQL